jgi:hypothetical protein
MEEAPENGKESSHSAHAYGMNERIWNVTGQGEVLTMLAHKQQTSNKTPSCHKTYVQIPGIGVRRNEKIINEL